MYHEEIAGGRGVVVATESDVCDTGGDETEGHGEGNEAGASGEGFGGTKPWAEIRTLDKQSKRKNREKTSVSRESSVSYW